MSLSLTDRRLDAFYEITSDSAASYEERLQRLLGFGCEIFGLATGILARIRDEHYEIVAVAPGGGQLKVGSRLPLADTYCSSTVRSEHPVGFARASGTAWERHGGFLNLRFEAYLGTQVRVGGRPWGTLSFSSRAPMPRDFDAADRGFIKLLAQWIGFGTDWLKLNQQTARAYAADLSRAMIGAIDEGVICIDTTPPHRICFVNPLAERLLGLTENAAIGRPLADLIELLPDPGSCCRGINDWTHCPQHGEFEAMLRTAGRPEGFPAALSFAPVALDGDALTVLTLRDIGKSRQTEEKLRLSDKVFEYSAEAIVITDADARILAVNPAFTWLTGYRPDEAIGQTPRILKSGRHDDAFYATMWQALLANGHWEGELWDRRKDGTEYPKWLTINAVADDGRTSHYVALFSDMSERKENEDRIRFLAEHDHLTGLPNRRLMEARARQLIASGRRRDAGLALMVVDLDRFKNVNDSYGHPVGDRLLIEVAHRLVANVRDTDMVVRLGGDEFVVLLEDIHDAEAAAVVAGKIRAALNQPVVVDDKVLHTPPSIGIALFPDDGDNVDTLLQNADTALYQVKAAGRNAWMFYTGQMNEAVRLRLQLENDMRAAFEADAFSLHFQPQFDINSRRIIAWEALLRWPHPQHGWIPPDQFIPVAEETGFILALGDWVLRSACREARRWLDDGLGRYRISVNVSALQLAAPDFADGVARVLADTDLDPAQLELEITESVLMSRSSIVPATIRRLKELGVYLTLDDFGTGYCSLAYLQAYAVDRLKIDRSFVRDLESNPDNAAIVRAVISLARALKLDVVAEGVETDHQTSFLREHGCGETQGFLTGRPMPAEAVADFVAAVA